MEVILVVMGLAAIIVATGGGLFLLNEEIDYAPFRQYNNIPQLRQAIKKTEESQRNYLNQGVTTLAQVDARNLRHMLRRLRELEALDRRD